MHFCIPWKLYDIVVVEILQRAAVAHTSIIWVVMMAQNVRHVQWFTHNHLRKAQVVLQTQTSLHIMCVTNGQHPCSPLLLCMHGWHKARMLVITFPIVLVPLIQTVVLQAAVVIEAKGHLRSVQLPDMTLVTMLIDHTVGLVRMGTRPLWMYGT